VDLLRGADDRFAVVDVETTGVLNSDRIVEVAVVTVSPNGVIVDEWDTLVNPQRDVGPTYLHQVSASMVSAAPTFEEIDAALAERLNGAVLVAHNLPFDSRMLANEYDRSGGLLDPGNGVCTLRLSGEKLSDACQRHGIPLDNAHCALADARATAQLLQALASEPILELRPSSVTLPNAIFRPRTLRRDANAGHAEEMPYLARVANRARHLGAHGNALIYMDMLDWAISDLVITRAERGQLETLAVELGLAQADVDRVHHMYLESLLDAVLRDGIVDAHEETLLLGAAHELGVDPEMVTAQIVDFATQAGSFVPLPGMRVCFTGSATAADGSKFPRSVLEGLAIELGLEPVKNVSKSGCDLLVAADPTSQSGKAKKARDIGVPIASTAHFVVLQPGASLTTV